MESINDDYAHRIKLDDGQKLNLWRRISFYWKEEPADDILSVILPRPHGSESKWSLFQFIPHQSIIASSATITPSPSMENKLADKSEEIFEGRWIASESMSVMDPLTCRCRSASSQTTTFRRRRGHTRYAQLQFDTHSPP